MKKVLIALGLVITLGLHAQDNPLKVGVIGLTHTHVHWIFGSEPRGDIEISGIVEPNRELAKRYSDQYEFPMSKVFDTMDELIENTEVEAVTAFSTIYQHLEIVEKFAPLGIHVMVEKPLAVSMEHARKMKSLADKHGIHLLTNYETTWYPTNYKAFHLINNKTIGDVTKIMVHDGHKGPKKIGVNEEFLEWLTDPVQNGGGAITDFGCYGANLLTWFMQGQKPVSVTAITHQLQAENNPKVDDESIILLKYENAVAVIQGSWNWPIGRKDMEVYGTKGVIYADNRHEMRIRISEGYDGYQEEILTLEERAAPHDDPFALLSAVVKGKVELPSYDLSSLENNMIVVEILDAARLSAQSNKSIFLN